MDQETLTNHISKLGKHDFEIACRIVLTDIFNLKIINVDGKNDGGTDFTEFNNEGIRTKTAYQITTQKTDIKKKAYKDALKSIEKLGVDRFYFLTTFSLSETESRKLENQISNELNIQCTCLDAKAIAALLIDENLVQKFINDADYPLVASIASNTPDYFETALHSYTLLSEDSKNLKENIYDDTILFILSNEPPLTEQEIVIEAQKLLSLSDEEISVLTKRIGSLFGRQRIRWNSEEKIILKEDAELELKSRKSLYARELSTLAAAQADILQEHNIAWDEEDSRKISVWIAESFINEQISSLKEIKASIVSHPVFERLNNNGMEKIKKHIKKKDSKTTDETLNKIVLSILEVASSHPLIVKLTRASMYVALQGSNPVSSAKALGASRWSDFKVLIEPTMAIPLICSKLYTGKVNKYFDASISALARLKSLNIKAYIPPFYISECAGHLLQARKYNGLDLNENELKYSSNAFVSNYYALKTEGAKMPESFMDYLASYSPAIKSEKNDKKTWAREIMTDIQSILNKSGIEFLKIPFYEQNETKEINIQYNYYLQDNNQKKAPYLINHDVWTLKFINDSIVENNEHWIILTYDRSLIDFSTQEHFKGWTSTPLKFLSLSEATKPLSETKFVSLLHTVATYSERTLSAGARILDKFVQYASTEMQNWEFKRDIEEFKSELIQSIDYSSDYHSEIARRTEEFLKKKGIIIEINDTDFSDD